PQRGIWTERTERIGSSRYHNSAFGSLSTVYDPQTPCSAIFCSPSHAATTISSPCCRLFVFTCTLRFCASILGVFHIDSMWVRGTASIHTVCHIPVTGVYQMLLGSLTCLPLG